MNEDKLAKELEVYKELASKDKKIDVASLVINALQKQEANLLSTSEKRWAYLISLGLPPFGLIFAAKFYYSGKDDGHTAAWICIALTGMSVLLFFLLGSAILSSSGASLNQIQQIQPSDIEQLLQ